MGKIVLPRAKGNSTVPIEMGDQLCLLSTIPPIDVGNGQSEWSRQPPEHQGHAFNLASLSTLAHPKSR